MKNEIVRKLTSLTLMTIMFAGGLSVAFPGTMPQAHASHNANLFVSAENSYSNNIMTGPMVVEVVITDSSINRLDQAFGEPDVTVNGKKLRMIQGSDGGWHAFIADIDMAKFADATQPGLSSQITGVDNSTRPGKGLNFGKFCSKASGTELLGFAITDTEGVALPSNATAFNAAVGTSTAYTSTNGTDGTATFLQCTTNTPAARHSGATSASNREMNVIRQNVTVNHGSSTISVGQIGLLDSNYWPFIQLYDFVPTGTVDIKYNKAGSVQTTTLKFDSMSGISLSTDRDKYPADSQVHLTLQDFQLNIDPTNEDSWTWGSNVRDSTTNKTVFYMLFNDTGARDADGRTFDINNYKPGGVVAIQSRPVTSGAQNLFGNLTTFMFDKNGMLTFNNNTAGVGTDPVKLFDNGDSALFIPNTAASTSKALRTNTLRDTSLPITLTETSSNSGIFTSTDESNISTLKINDQCYSVTSGVPTAAISNVCRGKTASITYNDVSHSILSDTSFATINMDESAIGGEWNSGEKIPVKLVDNDANLNSKVDEDLKLTNLDVKVYPAISIGSPITLAKLSKPFIDRGKTAGGDITIGTTSGTAFSVDSFSDVARIGIGSGFTIHNKGGFQFNLTTTGADLKTFLANGTKEGTSTPQNGIFHYLNYDLRSFATNSTGNILAGANLNFSIQDSDRPYAKIGSSHPGGATKGGSYYGGFTNRAIIPALGNVTAFQGLIDISNAATSAANFDDADTVTVYVNVTNLPTAGVAILPGNYTVVIDLFRFGTSNDGDSPTGTDRFNDAIYRLELEESGLNTATFEGNVQYIMLNQLNINKTTTYTAIKPISNQIKMIVQEDLTDEDGIRVNYNDLAGDGSVTPTADQQNAPTHSGVVSFDFDNYKVADTVTLTLTDQDLNVDTEVIDVFTTVTTTAAASSTSGGTNDAAFDEVGTIGFGTNSRGEAFGRLLDVTFDDEVWLKSSVAGGSSPAVTCASAPASTDSDGLAASGFTLVETGVNSGVFKGTFIIPSQYCARAGVAAGANGVIKTTTGKDLAVDYLDYRDASGEIVEVGDTAGIRANTGTISLDRTVYPVPWGTIADIASALPTGKTPTTGTTTRSLFPIHETGISTNGILDDKSETLNTGDVTIHIRVNDADYNISPTGSDKINTNATSGTANTDLNFGPVKIMIQRGTDIALLATAGAAVANTGVITSGSTPAPVASSGKLTRTLVDKQTRELGPISEIAPDAGIFELDFTLRYTDGPLSTKCPIATTQYTQLDGGTTKNENDRFFALTTSGTAATGQFARNSTTGSPGTHCILQGDIITVEYRDQTDASGNVNTVTDSATFDLRNGVLQSDKSVYIIGSDMILTLIEPDFDRDNDAAETYDLDLVEWDSDAATITMGDKASIRGSSTDAAKFDPEPSSFRETGDSTGIFQVVIEIPNTLNTQKLDRGEKVKLEYTDWGPSGANFVGEESQDINLIIFTSNFGATVELDQKVYTWTDKVFITIVAPDHNFDSNLIDDIGNTSDDKIIVQTRQAKLSQYKLVETGPDTGIFTGEVILAGFKHDADGDAATGDTNGNDITVSNTQTGSGPTDGKLSSTDNDGLTVSFEFNQDETVVGSALIRWNIGEVSWLEASYPASGTGVVRVVDPDMNLNPESVDNFKADVWSDSDAGGIDLTVSETNEATGIFEGTVYFTTTDESSGHRLRVAEGDTITAQYQDNTLPAPYTRADELDVTGTSIIGTIVPPLERAPASNARVVDAFGNSLTSVSVDQQVQIAADLSNGQDRDQKFAYLVQVQDESGVTVSLAWITGTLTAGQSFSPALSWIPSASGTYTATVFVWESVDNPTALSPTVTTIINVS